MVNTVENDRYGYDLAIKLVSEKGNTRTADKLRRNGPPPYKGPGLAGKYALYNDVLFEYMDSPTLPLVVTLVPQFATEYGYIDRVNFGVGLYRSFTKLYPQLEQLDFTTQARKLDVPVYFLVGKKDVNAVASIVERYHNMLEAPHKELIWSKSGHGATADEIEDALVNHALKQGGKTDEKALDQPAGL
jgi:pimeloyl-ACP methyl ester carboxylesterase